VTFRIGERYIHLGSRTLPSKPLEVKAISVNGKFERLHFLHAVAKSGTQPRSRRREDDGNRVGAYVVHFEDGTTATVLIIFGEDVRDWWNWDKSKPVSRGKVAWRGENSYAGRYGVKIRLYRTSWKNPHPGQSITSLDFQSANSLSAPFCVAITGETRE